MSKDYPKTSAQRAKMVSAIELSEITGIHRTALVRMAVRGAITGHKFGKVWRFDLQEVLKETKNESPI